MKKHIYFITGTSRGIGAALAEALLKGDNEIHCFSRSGNDQLQRMAADKGVRLVDHKLDLSKAQASVNYLQGLFQKIKQEKIRSLTLVHNAGLLEPIGQIGSGNDLKTLEKGLVVNLVTPILITEQFVQRFQDWPLPKKVLNISTGAARNPYVSWNMYCSSKAGFDMHAQVLAEEQKTQNHPIKILALAPGVVDTKMQDLIRTKTEDQFPMLQRFVELKENGDLVDPQTVASNIIQLLESEDYGQEVLMDLRNN
ncbi:MAG: SDR family NAD(P)-dependent oxidoreductase [Bacteroidota bacterium]